MVLVVQELAEKLYKSDNVEYVLVYPAVIRTMHIDVKVSELIPYLPLIVDKDVRDVHTPEGTLYESHVHIAIPLLDLSSTGNNLSFLR